ncbi:NAD(P)-binding domain-containing protein [Pseudoteredinibacter isoporae]|uniref:Thioredoxin reductase n=1 Tax=Pseudoteredinibacter isoporae TaxID=570281 RepID=A0A7X0JQU5_9GAMM|nr:NAD(P)-binding domain-containing protein [Pseudoteredinibacter isoporae]MBB6520617.1 thioredoxin reductase [Pseudoteredinibacter isoporae]NHO86184.1 NAD(P)-binding domain-containing protein [Pseudoteredinibacter isoporae]NIB25365.1 NAD(P)-binding domain-containing protein [Pseudoteredinibacter isoporae]
MKNKNVVVIGAGPVGIAAAAHLIERGLKPIVLEKGKNAGAAMLEWGHVKVFTPWKYLVDAAVERLLNKTQWRYPDKESMPTGRDIVEQYLIPAATLTALKNAITYEAEVIAATKTDLSKSSSKGRDAAGYSVHYRIANGEQHSVHVDAVIDASGTWYRPNPIGLNGLPVPGESENQDLIRYGIPDVNSQRSEYEGLRTLVLGGGHSAINVVLDLLKLQENSDHTKVHWGLRTNNLEKLLGGGLNDQLPARGELGLAAKHAIDSGSLSLLAPLKVHRLTRQGSALKVHLSVGGEEQFIEVDKIVVSAGFRPDLSILSELRLDLDEIVEAPSMLAPLIDPNVHSCGTVKPHGVQELQHFDENFFIVGMKAYGRAPTFLMLTGYEQVRSIVAELAGDHEAARRVELVLPKTGACSTKRSGNSVVQENAEAPSACCTPSTAETTACCG